MPTNSLALGLGEIEVNSFLNQPLNAEIEVISARAGEIDDLLVGLASSDAFSRAGLSRPSSLSDLRFAVKKNEEGDSAVILVTTKASVKEPFLNFLVEADWSKGRLLREFTVLLDPPFYADTPAPAPVAKTQEIVPEPAIEPVETTVEAGSASDLPAIPEPIALNELEASEEAEDPVAPSEYVAEAEVAEQPIAQEVVTESQIMTSPGDVTVVKDDTLWSIASAIQAPGQSVNQIMLAIQRVNPDAFNDDNINNLKIGSVLRMPEASAIAEVNQQQAYAQVLEQNGLWDDYVARVTGQVPVAVEGDDGSEGGSQVADSSAELNLITPGDGQSDAASLQGEGEDANELRVKLALAEEELDASQIENQELESRIAELEARLSKFEELQKMVEIEDDSLAQLQAKQAEEEVVSSEAIDAAQQTADENELLEELLVEEATDSENAADTDSMTEDSMTGDSAAKTESSDVPVDESTQEQASETPPVPVIVTEPVSDSPSLLDGILPPAILDMIPDMGGILPSMDSLALDPVMLGGLGGILLLLIGLVVYKRKKKPSESDDEFTVNDPIFVAEEDDLTPIHLAESVFEGLEDDSGVGLPEETGATESLTQGVDFGGEEEHELARTAVVSKDEMPEAEESAGVDEQDDILNEADVYLAYNLYDNAEE
ncbi:MAG: LysM peptidoglycan-binding domain-containing protein, partial [Gammaproteobacteria bacterium]|nr:LysM peptidoglycan-binding domain-containing protein [Gammaproteobacteria bacterium]